MKYLIIYHGGCRDGFCAAFVVRHALLCNADIPLSDQEFLPAQYGEKAPIDLARDKKVFIVDFSYPLEAMKELVSVAKSVVVLDHHKTSDGVLSTLKSSNPAVMVCYDIARSGARLAWDYFHLKQDPVWWLVEYVEDRDLWRWVLPESKAINAYISTLPFDFGAWEAARLASWFECKNLGKAVLAKIDQYAVEVCKQARLTYFDGRKVYAVNAAYPDISEVLYKLLETRGGSVVLGWSQRADGRFVYSLRGDGTVDVSEIAKRYGGGGHKSAAGFESDVLVV